MSLETVTYISDLNLNYPGQSEDPTEGAGHLRNIKKGLTNSFVNFAGIPMTATEAELNTLDGITSVVAELNILDGVTAVAAELNYNDITTLGTVEASKSVTADGSGITTNAKLASPVLNTAVSGTAVLDEDDMATDSATQLATQQSIKAYTDAVKTEDYIHIEEQQTAGTSGSASTTSFSTAVFNTEVADAGGHATLSANVITLAAGTYRFSISAPGYACGKHVIQLYNNSDTAVEKVGTATHPGTGGGVSRSIIKGRFTIASAKDFIVQHKATSVAGTGFGLACNLGVTEIYGQVEFWKEN